MIRHPRTTPLCTVITWMLVALMVEPQSRVLGQESSTYVRALEVLLAPASKLSSTPNSHTPILMAQNQSPLPVLGGEGERVRATVHTNLVLGLTRTPITLTNGHEMLGLSFFSDSNHNYVVEFRDDIEFDLCNKWQPLTNAPHNYGIVFTESQATNRFFRLRRIDAPRAPLFALLAHDTGTNSLDGITSDPTITGMALKFPAGTELQASLNNPGGPFTTITNLGSPRYFLLTLNQLAALNGGSLPDGSHILYLRAVNGASTLGSFEIPFTLDTEPPTVTVSLASAFDSPPLGDGRTTFNPVTLKGQSEPGTRLELLATTSPGDASVPVIHQIVPDANGGFILTNVVLAQGTNQFYFRALDAACNESISESRLCWYGSECVFPDNLEGWQIAVSPTSGMPGSVTVASDKLCTAVMTEGDSFLVTLSRAFLIPTIPSVLSLNYQATFDATATHLMRDAFEVALVDAAGRPLTYTIQGTNAVTPASVATPPVLPPSPDAVFNHTDGHAPFTAPGANLTAQPSTPGVSTLLVDVSHLPPGSTARLILRLVNNDRDRATSVSVTDVNFKSATPGQTITGSPGTALALLGVGTARLRSNNSTNPCPPAPIRFQSPVVFTTSPQASSPACVPPPSGLVAWWPGEGNANDICGTNNGTVQGGVTFVPGEVGQAFALDGTSGFIEVPNSPSLNPSNQITVAAWYRPESFIGSGNTPIVDKAYTIHSPPFYQYHLGVTGDRHGFLPGTFGFAVGTGGAYNQVNSPTHFWTPGLWYHVVGTYDGSYLRLFVNGVVVGAEPLTGIMEDYGKNLRIGGFANLDRPNLDFLPGTVDEVALFNRALSTNEINELFAAGIAGMCKGAHKIANPTLVSDPNDTRVWQGATIGTFAELFYGTNTPATRQLVVDRQLLDAGLFSLSNSFPATLIPTPWPVDNTVRGRALDSTGTGSFEDETVENLFDTFTTANTIDNLWFVSSGNIGDTVFDLGAPSSKAAVFPTIDHGPLPQEAIESTVYLSPDRVNWTQATVQRVWLEGWHPLLGIKWDGFVFAVGTSNRQPFRYVSIIPGGPGALLSDGDNEINGVVGLTEDFFPVQRIVPSSPTLTITAPADNARLGPSTALLTGYALADRPDIFGIPATNNVLLVTVNGAPVDTLDTAGNFFSAIEVRPGQNVFEVVAMDTFNQSTTNTVMVYGTTCPQNFASLGEVSASVVPEYMRTSFNEWMKVLYADLALRNAGTYPIRAPFYVGITRISDPSVKLLAPDGVSADGVPYYDYTEALANGALGVGRLSLPRALAFHNPNKVQFTYDLVVLGQLNQAPAFTTAPILEGIAGKPYTYSFNATDPDGDLLTYSLAGGPVGLTLNSQLQSLAWSPAATELGTHDIRLRADDGKGGIAEQHYLLSVINQPSNRPPYFVSTPVTMARVFTGEVVQVSGSVFLTGHDPDFHANPGGNEVGAKNLNHTAIRFITDSNYNRFAAAGVQKFIFVESKGEIAGGHTRGLYGMLASGYRAGIDFDHHDYTTLSNALRELGSTYSALVIASDYGGMLTQAELDVLNSHSAEIMDFLNAGGGLYAMAESNGAGQLTPRGGHFQFLPFIITSTAFHAVENGNIVTPFGLSIGLLDSDINGNATHNYFNSSAGLHVVDMDPADRILSIAAHGMVRPNGMIRSGVYNYEASAGDPDADSLNYSLVIAPTNMTINPRTGLIVWSPNADQIGTHAVSVRVDDGRGGSATQSYRICVLSPEGNRPPIIVSQQCANIIVDESLQGEQSDLLFTVPGVPGQPVEVAFSWTIRQAAYNNEFGIYRCGPEGQVGTLLPLAPGYARVALATNNSQTIFLSGQGAGAVTRVTLYAGETYGFYIIQNSNSDALRAQNPDNLVGSSPLAFLSFPQANPDNAFDHLHAGAQTSEGLTQFFWEDLTYGGDQSFTDVVFTIDLHLLPGARKIYNYQVRAIDPDSDDLSYRLLNGPANAGIDVRTGLLSWLTELGSHDFRIEVSDGRGGVDKQTFTLFVITNQPGMIEGKVFGDLNRDGILGTASNLVVNGDFSLGNTGFISGLGYSPSDLGPPSVYTVGPDPGGVHGLWAHMGDHTSGSGLMQIINGSTAPGLIVWGQDVLVQTNTTYDFSTWLASSFPGSPARLRFSINGGLLADPIELNSQVAIWQRFYSRWDSGTNTLAQIAIQNDSLDFGGNDFVVDDIQFGQLEDIQVNQFLFLDLNSNGFRDDCEPITITDPSGNYTFSNVVAGDYLVRVLPQPKWVVSAPTNGMALVTIPAGGVVNNVDFTINPAPDWNPPTSPEFVTTPSTRIAVGEIYNYSAIIYEYRGLTSLLDLVTRPDGMLLETNSSVVAWRPTLSQIGVHEVMLRAKDDRGGVALQSWQITVMPPNAPPFITTFPPGPAVVGLPYQYLVRAQDAENQQLTFSLGSNAPAGLTLARITNALTSLGGESGISATLSWTPTLANLGVNPISIIVRDSGGAEVTQDFDLEVVVSAPNIAPSFTSTPRTQTRLDLTYAYLASASDPNGDPLSFELVTAPVGMIATNSLSSPGMLLLQWIPSAGQLGSNFVHVRVSDGRGGMAEQQFVANVTSTLNNAAPLIASLPPLHATAGQNYEYDLTANDPDGDLVTWRLVQAPVGLSIDPATGVLRWSPTLDQLGTNTVTVEAQDTLFATDAQTWQIDVGCLNRPPQITSIPPTSAQTGDPYLYALRAEDPDGDRIAFSFANTNEVPAGMTISNLTTTVSSGGLGGALIRWTPTTNQVGTHLIRIRLTDGRGGNDTQSYNLHVADLHANKAPYFVSTPVAVARVSTNDDRASQLFDLGGWQIVQYDVAAQNGQPDANWLLSASNTLAIQSVNSDPSILLSDEVFQSYEVSGTWRVADSGSDDDFIGFIFGFQDRGHFYLFDWKQHDESFPDYGLGSVGMSVKLVSTADELTAADLWQRFPPSGAVRTLWTNSVPWLRDVDYRFTLTFMADRFSIRVNQGIAVIAETTVADSTYTTGKFGFYNNSQGDVTYAGFIYRSLPESTYIYDSLALDPDADPVAYSLVAAPTNMTINPSSGLIRWEPSTNQIGMHQVMVLASDGRGGAGVQNYFVQVVEPRVNRFPIITSVPRIKAVPGVTYRYDVHATDADGDTLAFALVPPVPSGLNIDTLGRMSWTPSLAQLGGFPVTVSVNDSFGGNASQSFVINVAADTEPPSINLVVGYNLFDDAGVPYIRAGTTAGLRVDATDNVGVTSRELLIDGTAVPLSSVGAAQVPFTVAGIREVVARASDGSGNTASITNRISVVDPNAQGLITVLIHTPTNGMDVTAPVDVIATIISSNAPLADFDLDYAEMTKQAFASESIGDPSLRWQSIAHVIAPVGTYAVSNINLGRFDPTILQNGTYVLRVSAYDSNRRGQQEGVMVNVAGNLKFGEFRLQFTDLAIPVAGIPITITRVYDTRDSLRQGDFGQGWSLGVRDARIIESLKKPFSGLSADESTFTTRTRVYLNTPDGRRVGFNFTPQFASAALIFGAFYRPAFAAEASVYEKLEPLDTSAAWQIRGDGALTGGFGLVGYDPSTYRLITKDGTAYTYEENQGLQNVQDSNGNRLEYTRDGIFHYNTGSTIPDQSVTFVRDPAGRITQIIDPNGKTLRYTYDSLGDLRSFADQVTNTTRYLYSASRAHFLTNIVDPLGRSALGIEYDSSGRLKTVRDANGNPISQDFDVDSKSATFTDGNGTVIHTRYDDNGNEVVRRIEGVSTNYFAYDANNNLLASTNGRGFSTNYTYDIRGNVTSIADSLNNLTTIAYNELNKPVGVTNALGQILNLRYDGSGKLLEVINNAGLKTIVTRDSQGRVASLTDATGTNTTIFDYSNGCACGRPGKVTNPDGSFRLYEYNSQGLTNRVVNELGAETLFHHDESGKLLWMRDPLTNYTQFFYNGPLLTNVVDALGRSTRYEYDALNRTNKIIDAENGVVEFRYDNNGNRTHVIDAVTNVTTFVYDAANRVEMQIDPLGHTNFFAHDAAGNRTEAIDRNGRKRTFAYDAANRMTNEFWWEGTNIVRSIVFGFNERGVQTLAADPAARYEYSYDALNRLERVLSQLAGMPDFTLLYTYTALGQVASVTDHWGVRVGSGYDNRNRLASRTWSSTLPGAGVDPARVDFAYDISGNRVRTDRFADLAGTNRIGFTTNAYNRAGIVTNITHLGPASQVLAKYDYNFDAAYQITRWAIGNQLSDFAYDRTGQLTNALNTAQPNENFRFDANGNRVGSQSGGSYVVGGNNQILSDGTNRYAYDAEGNMTSRSNIVTGVLTSYQFDHRNRLVSVLDQNPGGVVTQTVAFVYDAMNRRLSKTVNGPQNTNVVRFLYNQDDSWADLDGTNAVIARYLHGARIDELLARQRAGDGRGWYLTDHLGTVRDISNAAGAVVAHVDYSSFGQVLDVSSPAAVDRFLFTGRELDGETGLQFFRARYYSAQLARFVSQDPIGFRAKDFNLYRYANNTPHLASDPFGTTSLFEYAIVTAATAAIAGFYTGFYCYLKNGDKSLLFKAPLFFVIVAVPLVIIPIGIAGPAAATTEVEFFHALTGVLATEEIFALLDCLFGFDDPF